MSRMNFSKPKPRELLLLVVPLILIVCALIVQFRPKALDQFSLSNRFYIEKIEFPALTPYEVSQGYDTKVMVVLNYRWPQPAWWNKQNGYSSNAHAGQLLFQNGDRLNALKTSEVYAQEPRYDKARDCYVAPYYLKLARIPKSDDAIVLRSQLGVGIWSKALVSPIVPVSCVVRPAGKVVTVPVVSRRSALSIERVLIRYATAAEAKRNIGCDTDVCIVFKREHAVTVGEDINSAVQFPTLTNEKGRSINTSGTVGGAIDAARSQWGEGAAATRPDTRYWIDHSIRLSGTKPKPRRVFLKNTFVYKGSWPLSYSFEIPIPASNLQKQRTIEVPFKSAPAARKP